MERPISKSTRYVAAAAFNDEMIYLIGEDRALSDAAHARMIAFYRGEFYHSGDRDWKAAGLGIARRPAAKVVAVGEDGDVLTYARGTAVDERIEPRPRCLRNLAVVDGLPVACGMDRQVWRRDGDGAWIALHAPPAEVGRTAGFEDVAGWSASELYAVGWNGEIWQHDGAAWIRRSSPTDRILTAATCSDGEVFACGQAGVLVRGRHDRWATVPLDGFGADFVDVAWFGGRLWLATGSALWVHGEDGLRPVDFGADAPATCHRVTTVGQVLWAVGDADVFAFDGATWRRID